MFSFFKRKSKADKALEVMPDAVELSAKNWRMFSTQLTLKEDVPLRERIYAFHQVNEQGLKNNFKALKDAPEAMTMLIAVKGMILSGDYDKETIEEAIGGKIP
jgi:hypothetical protein